LLIARQPDSERPRPDPDQPAHDQALESPLWAMTGLQRRERPLGARLDPALESRSSALEVPPRLRFSRNPFWWCSLASAVVCYLLLHWTVHFSAALEPSAFAARMLFAFWLDQTTSAQIHRGLLALLLAQLSFSAAYTCLACTLVVYGIRAVRDFKPQSTDLHTRFRQLTVFGLWGLLLSSWVGAVLSVVHFGQATVGHPLRATLLSLASACACASFVTLAGFLVFALIYVPRARFPSQRAPERIPAE
jgi:hypothetical protein